jgi:hypothetical protein
VRGAGRGGAGRGGPPVAGAGDGRGGGPATALDDLAGPVWLARFLEHSRPAIRSQISFAEEADSNRPADLAVPEPGRGVLACARRTAPGSRVWGGLHREIL